MKCWVIFFILTFLYFSACAAKMEGPEARAKRLGSQVRCPVCRGVSIADSPSALAMEMMDAVRRQVAEGKRDEEILKYFEERYGEWALLEPKAEGMNLMIWILPVLMVMGGAVGIIWKVRKRGSI